MADWFAPKRYGYGASLPIAWQGWALLIGYLALLVLAGFIIRRAPATYAVFVVIWTAAFIVIVVRNTKGGWRWRWGDKD